MWLLTYSAILFSSPLISRFERSIRGWRMSSFMTLRSTMPSMNTIKAGMTFFPTTISNSLRMMSPFSGMEYAYFIKPRFSESLLLISSLGGWETSCSFLLFLQASASFSSYGSLPLSQGRSLRMNFSVFSGSEKNSIPFTVFHMPANESTPL